MAIFKSEWQLALTGELMRHLDAVDEAVKFAARAALTRATEKGLYHLRDQVARAGLAKAGAGEGRGSGRSLASAIRLELYPRSGLARNPAAMLYIQPSAVHIFEAFDNDTTIRARNGTFLTIPVPGSPASRAEFGDKPRGMTVLERLKSRGIQIAFVKATANRPAMIVAENVRLRTNNRGKLKVARATLTKAGSFQQGVQSVPLFFLVPVARIGKRLNLARDFERIADEFIEDFSYELGRGLDAVARARAGGRAAA